MSKAPRTKVAILTISMVLSCPRFILSSSKPLSSFKKETTFSDLKMRRAYKLIRADAARIIQKIEKASIPVSAKDKLAGSTVNNALSIENSAKMRMSRTKKSFFDMDNKKPVIHNTIHTGPYIQK